LTSKNCERDKGNYNKGTNEYWSDIIFMLRGAKIYEEMSLVADKYSEKLLSETRNMVYKTMHIRSNAIKALSSQ
jgi:hypothetical protein